MLTSNDVSLFWPHLSVVRAGFLLTSNDVSWFLSHISVVRAGFLPTSNDVILLLLQSSFLRLLKNSIPCKFVVFPEAVCCVCKSISSTSSSSALLKTPFDSSVSKFFFTNSLNVSSGKFVSSILISPSSA